MEKTIEEIRKAVLAYCDEVCPQGARHDVVANDVTIGWMGHGDTMDGGLRMYFFADWMYIDADMDDRTALLAYRLLGLDKRDALEAEKEKSKRWESRAWKILQIAKDKSMESFAHSIRVAKLEADLAAVGNTEQNTKLKWEQTFKANPWDGVSVCATYMGLDFHIELQDDGKFEMSAMLHGALYGFGKVAIRQRAINQMDKIFNEMLQDPIDVMRIAERYAKD